MAVSTGWPVRGSACSDFPSSPASPRQWPPSGSSRLSRLSLSVFNLGGLLLFTVQYAAVLIRAWSCILSGGDRLDFIFLGQVRPVCRSRCDACFKAGGIQRAYFHPIPGHSEIGSVLHLVRTGTLKTVPSSQESHCLLRLFSKLLPGPNMYVSPCLSVFFFTFSLGRNHHHTSLSRASRRKVTS